MQVVAAICVVDIHIVRVVPVVRPTSWIRIDHAEPVTAILEARISADNQEGEPADSESMTFAEEAAKVIVGDAISAISAPVAPAAVVCLPVVRTVLLPGILLEVLLLR